jgi:hypothetical protein
MAVEDQADRFAAAEAVNISCSSLIHSAILSKI